jgi:hypothetical protein
MIPITSIQRTVVSSHALQDSGFSASDYSACPDFSFDAGGERCRLRQIDRREKASAILNRPLVKSELIKALELCSVKYKDATHC